jgi:CheY-like chemotaxis protein
VTPDARACPSAGRPRVLVVDDDAVIGAVLGRILDAFEVTFAQSAPGALGRVLGGATFRAVVCDVVMPGMSGFQFHEELGRIAPDLAKRVVFLTGFATAPEVEAFVRSKGVPCLPKPFEPQALRAAVAEMARR